MEACLSAHFVSRALRQLGHQPRIIPAIYVKPFVKGQKNDYNDAEAIAEAALRPNLRVVREKTQDQLDLEALHRVRSRLVSRRTATINQIRAFLIEQGIAVRDWGDGSAELAPGDLEDPAGRDIAANARSDRGSLRRLDTSR
jgi:transposase